MRLDRYIANATGISRKLAQSQIKSGCVLVDNQPSKNTGLQLKPDQRITLNGDEVVPAQHLYLMLHKPMGTICANTDGLHPTVIDLLDGAKEAAHPTAELQIAGRLDIDTTGLVLLTTDGQWNHKITAPSKVCTKTYLVHLAEPLNSFDVTLLEQGITLKTEKKPTLPCSIQLLDGLSLRIEINEGKYHQVKRMFAAVGNKVLKLHRERIGNILLPDNLAPGEFRALSESEIQLQ